MKSPTPTPTSVPTNNSEGRPKKALGRFHRRHVFPGNKAKKAPIIKYQQKPVDTSHLESRTVESQRPSPKPKPPSPFPEDRIELLQPNDYPLPGSPEENSQEEYNFSEISPFKQSSPPQTKPEEPSRPRTPEVVTEVFPAKYNTILKKRQYTEIRQILEQQIAPILETQKKLNAQF